MEFKQKEIKFMAQQYLEGSHPKKPKWLPLLHKRNGQWPWDRLSRESSAPPLFPDIHSGRQSRQRGTPNPRMPSMANVDMPGPAAYSPPTMTGRETNAPSYTFGCKTPPREGGGRRAWQKSWFQSKNPFTKKADFVQEANWPSPFHYGQLGSKPPNQTSSPSFTMGQKGEFTFVSKDTVDKPAPNKYFAERAYFHILHKSPSFVISPAPQHLFRWASKEATPGPGAYNVETGHIARLPSSPGFFIQGVRRPKKHETGPFSSL